jgi:hypothetical protein
LISWWLPEGVVVVKMVALVVALEDIENFPHNL